MSKTTLVWIVIFSVLIALFINARSKRIENDAKLVAERESEQIELKKRYLKGAFVDNESKISEFETTKTIIYPGRSENGENYSKWYDTTCFVYTNTQLKQSKIKCTGMLLDEDDDTNGDMQDYQTTERYGRHE